VLPDSRTIPPHKGTDDSWALILPDQEIICFCQVFGVVATSKYRHDEVPMHGPPEMAGYGVEMISGLKYGSPGYDIRTVLADICFSPLILS